MISLQAKRLDIMAVVHALLQYSLVYFTLSVMEIMPVMVRCVTNDTSQIYCMIEGQFGCVECAAEDVVWQVTTSIVG